MYKFVLIWTIWLILNRFHQSFFFLISSQYFWKRSFVKFINRNIYYLIRSLAKNKIFMSFPWYIWMKLLFFLSFKAFHIMLIISLLERYFYMVILSIFNFKKLLNFKLYQNIIKSVKYISYCCLIFMHCNYILILKMN